MTYETYRKIGLAALTGGLSIVIFPSFDVEWLAWIAFVPLLAAIRQATLKAAFGLGWCAGVLHFTGTLYWVTVAMTVYGGIHPIISGGLLLMMGMFLALYLGSFCLIIRYLQEHTAIPLIVTAPVIWVGLEYVRTFFLFGFPWNLLGYSQFLTPTVTQIADLTSVYGVSWLILLVNVGLYVCLFSGASRPLKLKTGAAALCCVGCCVGYGLYRLPAAPAKASQTVKVAVVQGNIPQNLKWDPAHRQAIFDTYVRLSQRTLTERPELIVWPETAAPFTFRYEPSYRLQLERAVQGFGTHLLFGGLDLVLLSDRKHFNSLNSAFLLSPAGQLVGKYDKIHLVPFGEYVPFKKLLFFVDKLTSAVGEVQAGTAYQVLAVADKPFGTVICFEIIFPDLVRKFVDKGARFLVTITNDAWYNRTAAPYQHFAMVTFRAIENRVAIARAANTGVSGFIDPYGRILAQGEIFVEDALVHEIPLSTTTTFYTRHGDVFAKLCLLLSVLGFGYGFYQHRCATTRMKNKQE